MCAVAISMMCASCSANHDGSTSVCEPRLTFSVQSDLHGSVAIVNDVVHGMSPSQGDPSRCIVRTDFVLGLSSGGLEGSVMLDGNCGSQYIGGQYGGGGGASVGIEGPSIQTDNSAEFEMTVCASLSKIFLFSKSTHG